VIHGYGTGDSDLHEVRVTAAAGRSSGLAESHRHRSEDPG
jgi:hypothetical protein